MNRLRRLVSLSAASIAVATLLLSPSHVQAASSRDAKEREAKKACLNGQPGKGVEILTDLYVDTKNPTYLFNQGRCFEQNRRYEDAIGRFREYLLQAETLPETAKASAQKHIAACQSFLADRKMGQPKAAAETPVSAELPAPAAVEKQPAPAPAVVERQPEPALAPVELVDQPRPTPVTQPGRGLRVAGIVAAAVGVAGLGAGIALNLKVNSMSRDLSKQDQYKASTNSTRETYKTIGWLGYGVGAACLASGAVLYFLGWRSGQDTATTALIPTVGPNMAGAGFAGTF